MTTQTSTADLHQLTQAVAGLTDALAKSERRHAHLARTIRWGALALVSVLVFAGFIVAERVGTAYAQAQGGFPQADSVVEALNNINTNLTVMGEMGKVLQQLSPVMQEALMQNEEVRSYVQQHCMKGGGQPTQQQMQACAMEAITQSVVGTFVDTVVLMNRIRQDSDAFRDYITGPEDVLRGLEHELELMNVALSSVPAMAVQMDLMNRNMASMTYSMGSTMGRMGKWVPW